MLFKHLICQKILRGIIVSYYYLYKHLTIDQCAVFVMTVVCVHTNYICIS